MGLVVAIALLSWFGSLTAPAAAPPLASQSVAYKLAVIQSGHSLDQSDPLVGQMQRALDALQPRCRESEARLAAEAVVTQEDLARHGLADTDLAVLRSVRGSIPARFARTRCADIFAAWLVLREQGT